MVCGVDVWLTCVCSVLCSEMAVKMIDAPFVTGADDLGEWAL